MSTNIGLEGKFIGGDTIVGAEVLDMRTPQDKDILEITFKSGKKRVYPAATVERIVTDEVSDASAVSEKKLLPVVREVMAILAENDISVGEIDMFQKQLGSNIENAFNRATSFMWFKDDTEFVPNFNPMFDVSLLMAHKVITNIKHDTDAAGSAGQA